MRSRTSPRHWNGKGSSFLTEVGAFLSSAVRGLRRGQHTSNTSPQVQDEEVVSGVDNDEWFVLGEIPPENVEYGRQWGIYEKPKEDS